MTVPSFDPGPWVGQLATGVGIAVGVVGVLAAFGQLSPLQRLRDLEAWAAARSADETAPHRKEALETLRRDATARLVAGSLVPTRHFLWGAVQLPVGVQMMIGGISQDTSWWGIGWRLILGAQGLFFAIRQIERIWAERYVVKVAYLSETGRVPEPKLGILSRMEGGTRKEFNRGYLVSYGLGYVLLGGWLAYIDHHRAVGLAIAGLGVAALFWALPSLVSAIKEWALRSAASG